MVSLMSLCSLLDVMMSARERAMITCGSESGESAARVWAAGRVIADGSNHHCMCWVY